MRFRCVRLLTCALTLAVHTAVAANAAAEKAADALSSPLHLSLEEAITLGLKNNLNVEVERHAPLIAFHEREIARGAYDPVLGLDLGYQSNETPIASSLQTASMLIERTVAGQIGLSGLIPLWGATYSLGYSGNSLESTSNIQALSPEYRSGLLARLTAPLLRNFIWNEPWTQVKATRLAHRQALEQLREALMNTVRDTENAYWNLVAAQERLRVANKSLEATKALLEQTQVQYEVGVVSKVEVTEARAGVAERELNQIQADNALRAAQDRLVDLVYGRALQPLTELEVIPSERADDYTVFEIDREQAAEKAFKNRPELAAAHKEIERQKVLLQFAQNQRLPQLDVEVNYGLQGLAGQENPGRSDFNASDRALVNSINSSIVPLGATPIPAPQPRAPLDVDRRYSATDDLFFDGAGAQQWGVKGIFSVPLGNRRARHAVSQQELALRRSRTQLKRLEQGVVLEIREATRRISSALQGIEAAERRRQAVEEQFEAERIRLEAGESTPFDVLQRERDLVDAESQKIEALRSYRDSVTALHRAQGTTLFSHNILFEEAQELR